MEKSYILKPGVVLDKDIESKVKKIADAYYKLSKKMIVITSGTRSAKSQASAMYGKLAGGDKLTVYRDQKMAKEILGAYDTSVDSKKTKEQILISLQDTIDEQIKKGKYISKHLKKGAVDVRSRDMTDIDKKNFKASAAGVAKLVILETIPPHLRM